MMKNIVFAMMMIAAVSVANAAQTNNGCQGNCPSSGDTTNNTTNQGGTGYGGNGTGIGVGLGVGVSVSHGGNGGEGGAGGAGGSISGSGNSSATGGSVVGSGNSANVNRNNNQSSATGGSNTNSNANSGNNSAQSVNVQGDTYQAPRIPVATAYAPTIAPTALCMGSTSGGVQGMSIGVSIGSSWTDSNCVLLEGVRAVATVLGDKDTAAQMMCGVAAYREARAKTGKPCAE